MCMGYLRLPAYCKEAGGVIQSTLLACNDEMSQGDAELNDSFDSARKRLVQFKDGCLKCLFACSQHYNLCPTRLCYCWQRLDQDVHPFLLFEATNKSKHRDVCIHLACQTAFKLLHKERACAATSRLHDMRLGQQSKHLEAKLCLQGLFCNTLSFLQRLRIILDIQVFVKEGGPLAHIAAIHYAFKASSLSTQNCTLAGLKTTLGST